MLLTFSTLTRGLLESESTWLKTPCQDVDIVYQWEPNLSNSFFRFVPIVLEYTFIPSQDRWRAKDPVSKFHGFEHTTAASSAQSLPSSPRNYTHNSWSDERTCSTSSTIRTLTIIFAPIENPIPNKGRLGNIFLNHLTTCRTSHVDLAL